jgi:hypothetical protein
VIRNAQRFGFSLKELAAFMHIRESGGAPCDQVRAAVSELSCIEAHHRLLDAASGLRIHLNQGEFDGLLSPGIGVIDAIAGLLRPVRPGLADPIVDPVLYAGSSTVQQLPQLRLTPLTFSSSVTPEPCSMHDSFALGCPVQHHAGYEPTRQPRHG